MHLYLSEKKILKLKPWYEPRKSPLNIEIIEFC